MGIHTSPFAAINYSSNNKGGCRIPEFWVLSCWPNFVMPSASQIIYHCLHFLFTPSLWLHKNGLWHYKLVLPPEIILEPRVPCHHSQAVERLTPEVVLWLVVEWCAPESPDWGSADSLADPQWYFVFHEEFSAFSQVFLALHLQNLYPFLLFFHFSFF